ncbi:MAG: ribbon-helix-helix protein, CopG family [Peptostreptococcus sp.]|uniref:ribbon-helix-helix protein, CopG family n=1 Tax=Peptostreptococcus sp. TaxID=1262 RepID=UPI0029096E07|nr:ribbon-helix-helix protein, CopG family [Peptostreptococcus sp.]MDU5349993.1 ribbon-helix-helix protein, CopG family [Peptostreptococcus sp.]MDU5891829.1 ribbon-helix-helix protein, CopG family [Peptostreptococcus sp.]
MKEIRERKNKKFDLKVRVDEDINEKLLAYCEERGQTRAEVIRELLEEKFGSKQYEQVEKKVMYKDSGNNWSTVQIVLPISWVKELNMTSLLTTP